MSEFEIRRTVERTHRMSFIGVRRCMTLAAIMGALPALAQLPAFPGAQGFGAYATGGRGGDVYTVTNLNSSGNGSLRYGIENAPSQGRTIVFAVSGYIPISNNNDTGNKTVRVVRNKVTIAGQTAPGAGVGLKDGRLLLTGNNAVVRHLRIRHGKYGGAGDCLNLDSSASDSIIDHVSLMFSTDENISFFNSALDDFTMQYSTSSWGMERHNAGGLWDLQDGSCHHSLWAHHRTRNPKARPYGLLEWINNVTYHWRGEGFIMGDSQSNQDWKANVRGCYYLSVADEDFGLNQTAFSKARIGSNGTPNFSLYLDNTLHDADGDGVLDGTDKGYGIVAGQPYNPSEGAAPGTNRYVRSATPFPGASGRATVVIDDPLTAYKKVLSSSGALRLDARYAGPLRDELDTLLIESVVNQESILVAKDTPVDGDDPPSNGEAQLAGAPYNISNNGFGTLEPSSAPLDSDGDGMPNEYEAALGWNVSGQDHNTALSSSGGLVSGLTFLPANSPAGYTRLEEYLHFKAIPHATIPANSEAGSSSITVDLRRYTDAFDMAPVVFSISNVSNGSAELRPNGYEAVFTPTLEFTGRSRFDFTVTDGDGSTWTQTFAMLVKPSDRAVDGDMVTIQAESETIGGGVTTESNNPGWNGFGFVNFPTSGGSLQFDNVNGGTGGTAELVIRYALGSGESRTGNLVVNGATVPITFQPTGAWTTWLTRELDINLGSGATNYIRFESTGQDLANIDEITVTPVALPLVSIMASDNVAGEFGDDTELRFTISRSGGSSEALTVPLVASGSATAGLDYSGFSGEVNLPAGVESVDNVLSIESDDLAEGTESVVLSIGAGSGFEIGNPSSAGAPVADRPSQDYFFHAISDSSKRGGDDDGDDDGQDNLVEYFMGSDAGDPSGRGIVEVTDVGDGSFTIRYSRAKDRSDVAGALQWSADLEAWFGSGQSDGTHTVTFGVPVVLSPQAVDPEVLEITATVSGATEASRLYVRLLVE